MYRQSQAMKEKEQGPQEEQFLVQVGSLPVVQSAMGQFWDIYSRTKESNRLMRFTLNTAESGVTLAANVTKPIVTKLPVGRLNAVACNQLEQLKEAYPVITKPTDQILAQTKGLYDVTLKPTVDRVSAVRQNSVESVTSVGQYGIDKVNGVKNYTKDKVVGATQYSLAKIQDAKDKGVETVGALLQSPCGQVVAAKVDTMMDITDNYVERYLPPLEEDTVNGGVDVDMAEAPQPGNTLTRVGMVSDKVRRRMLNRAFRQLKHIRVRSEETVAKLNFTVDLIQFAKNNLDNAKAQMMGGITSVGQTASNVLGEISSAEGRKGLKDQVSERFVAAQERLGHIWTEINKTEEDVDVGEESKEGETDASKLERQAIATARHLTRTLKGMFGSLTSIIGVLPTMVQEKVGEAKSISETLAYLYSSTRVRVQDIPQIALDNTRLQLSYLQETLSFLADTTLQMAADSPALNWMVPSWVSSMLGVSKPPKDQVPDLELENLGTDLGFDQQEDEEEPEHASTGPDYVPYVPEDSPNVSLKSEDLANVQGEGEGEDVPSTPEDSA